MFSKLFTRILVPYDGSKYSDKALLRAIEVAHNLDSEIFLFHVINIRHISPPGTLLGLTRSQSEKELIKKWSVSVKNDAQKMLDYAAKKCQSRGITVNKIIVKGNTSNKIFDFAKKKKITIIIIGSQGLHGLNKLKTLGSTSRKVSEHSHCPVLIVR